MADLPSGAVTFLFTDIEGSTRLWDAHHAAMAVAVAEHDALLRQVITERRGYVFKTVGDAFCAAFPSAADALEAALAAQRSLASRTWPEVGTIRVRMGLHTGEAEERDSDYFGPAVNRVARLMSVGHGGQVLLSLAAAEALGTLPDGTQLRDLGDRRLKDLTQPERIFQLVVPGLPEAFPPLNSLDARPNNLPVQPTALLGRVEDLAILKERLRRPGTRVVTLTGPGGTGKTRLALQAAADLIDVFPHGAWFVDLGAVTEPDLVAAETARALGVREESGRSLTEQLVEHLRDKELLLVLDNFEQVLPAARLVSELLGRAPKLRVLVTSRAPLRVGGEQEYPVPPLPVPDPKRLLDLAHLEAIPSVELFVERAAAVKPGFTLTAENARSVAEVCIALDGLPLAIELAAARVRLLPPAKLAERLGRRLQVLTGGQRDRPERQQTLRATIAWSHDLLDQEGQALFARLSVFAGGCTLEAAEAVANATGDLDVFEGLGVLVENSLMRQEEPEDGEPRFRMLATIREFAEERLAEQGEAEDLRRAHAVYFSSLAGQAEPELTGPDQITWLNGLATEHDNLRAALSELLESDAAAALRLAASLWRFWRTRGHLSEGRRWLDEALERAATSPNTVRATALGGLGALAGSQGDLVQARAHHEAALATWQELGDSRGIAESLANLGLLARMRGDYGEATRLYEDVLDRNREAGNVRGKAVALYSLGTIASQQGDHSRARTHFKESVALLRHLGDRLGEAAGLGALGVEAFHAGDYAESERQHAASLDLTRALGDRRGTAAGLINLGHAVHQQGDADRAIALYEEALLHFEELGDKGGKGFALVHLGRSFLAKGELDRASAFLVDGLRISHEVSDLPTVAEGLEGLAAAAMLCGDAEQTARLLGTADALRERIGAPLPAASVADVARSRADATTVLGPQVFESAHLAGAALTVEEALAMSDLPPRGVAIVASGQDCTQPAP